MIDLKKLRENLDDFCTYGSDKVPAFSGREVRAIFEALEAAQEDAARWQYARAGHSVGRVDIVLAHLHLGNPDKNRFITGDDADRVVDEAMDSISG